RVYRRERSAGCGRSDFLIRRCPKLGRCCQRWPLPRIGYTRGKCAMKPVWRRSLDREADRSRRFPPPDQGRLRVEARDDPITGLVAWTSYYPAMTEKLATDCGVRRSVGLAIVDEDNLMSYGEVANAFDVES